jgi:hypothetical protein
MIARRRAYQIDDVASLITRYIMAEVSDMRWTAEEFFESNKGEAGLDQYVVGSC